MHRALNIKHRIVRRIDVGKAPLATFDTIDLGDGETQFILKNHRYQSESNQPSPEAKLIGHKTFITRGPLKSEIIGGNNSKKSLSQAGGGKDEKKDVEVTNVARNDKENPDETGTTTTATSSKSAPLSTPLPPAEKDVATGKDTAPASESNADPEIVAKDNKEQEENGSSAGKTTPAYATSGLIRQGTLGRVSIPIRKQDSVSSSSSSETCNDTHFNFSATRPSIAHLDSADAGPNLPDSAKDKDTVSSLIPDNIDPSQILSPSKRKAYEKRIERLKVTTSPIARPRSTAPINVITLEEYANLSSPEASPASPSVLQDKLKITLPTDEFASKPKTPKNLSAKKHDSEDTCFEFTEDILFRCTKSALVVEEDGHLPLSPRRVLIPPTITPSTSPKLSTSPNHGKDDRGAKAATSAAPKLIYFKEDINAQTFFGKTVDQSDNENWADFPDSKPNFEKADSECSEKEVQTSSYLSNKVSLADQPLTVAAFAEGTSLSDCTEEDKTGLSCHNTDIDNTHLDRKLYSDENITISEDGDHLATKSKDNSPNFHTSYNIKENSDDVLVLEILQHKPEIEEQTSEREPDITDQNSVQQSKLNDPRVVQVQESEIKEQNIPHESEIKEITFQQESKITEQNISHEESDNNKHTTQRDSDRREQEAFPQECKSNEQADVNCVDTNQFDSTLFSCELKEANVYSNVQTNVQKDDNWALFETVPKGGEQECIVANPPKTLPENWDVSGQSHFPLVDLPDTTTFSCTAETQPTSPNATSLLDSSTASPGDGHIEITTTTTTTTTTNSNISPWFLPPPSGSLSTTDDSQSSSSISPKKAPSNFHEDGLLLIDSQPFEFDHQGHPQQPFAGVPSEEDPQPNALVPGQVTLTPFSDIHSSSSPSPSADLMSFSSSQNADDTVVVTDQ